MIIAVIVILMIFINIAVILPGNLPRKRKK